ncbi:MAG: UbiA prenyltransferase family protein [Rhodospirillales bacterium]
MLRDYLRLARPLDWLKNGFVLLGLLFAEAWDDRALVVAVALVTIAFCFAASAVYALNDAIDATADSAHQSKRLRPVASGALSTDQARRFAAGLGVIAIGLAASVNWRAAVTVTAYLLLNAAYTFGLKRIAFLDVLAIALGFMLRVLAGTWGVGIAPSGWLLANAAMLTLFLGLAKRRAEIVSPNDSAATRRALLNYHPRLLDWLVPATALGTFGLYLAFSLDSAIMRQHGTNLLWLTALFVALGLGRYVFLVFRRAKGENPARDLVGDWIIGLAILGWIATTAALLAIY